jgi:uncharacterized lipoprotein YddW (UPF0748 family)
MSNLMIQQRRLSGLLLNLLITLSLNPFLLISVAYSQTLAQCKLSPQAIAQKENLRQAALTRDSEAIKNYNTILTQHAQQVNQCRQQINPKNQAIWLRLYPCDTRTGEIDRILDNIINKGYNKVYLEVFYDGQVLLPSAKNPTAWPAAIRIPGTENQDLLAETIQKGRQRGLKVYACVKLWLYLHIKTRSNISFSHKWERRNHHNSSSRPNQNRRIWGKFCESRVC